VVILGTGSGDLWIRGDALLNWHTQTGLKRLSSLNNKLQHFDSVSNDHLFATISIPNSCSTIGIANHTHDDGKNCCKGKHHLSAHQFFILTLNFALDFVHFVRHGLNVHLSEMFELVHYKHGVGHFGGKSVHYRNWHIVYTTETGT